MNKYIPKILGILFSILFVAMLVQSIIFKIVDQNNTYKITNVLLTQVIDLFQSNKQNSDELYASVKEDYKVRAQSVSYILDSKSEAVFDIEELKKISKLLSIDEINIFDSNGKIYSGTVPKYYGMTFDSGEQMSYFKPMLSDKSLKMCQDLTPNTSENKMMMYAITWNEYGNRMIQIGIEPERLLKAMERSQISTLLDKMPAYAGTKIIVIDAKNKKVLGSNILEAQESEFALLELMEKHNVSKKIYNKIINISKERYYCSCIANDSYIVSVACPESTNNDVFIVSLLVIFVYLILAGIFICRIIISRDKAEKDKLSQFRILSAMSRIYYSIHVIDFRTNLVEDFISGDSVERMNRNSQPYEIMYQKLFAEVSEKYQTKVAEFTDLNTVQERLKGKRIISHNFIGIDNNWYKGSFISVEENRDSLPEKVIFVVRNIHDEKMKEAALVQKSETDELTGLLNRRAYEDTLKKLDLKEDFIYITFDLNSLKNANDTIGHDAGDELIIAAGRIMTESFGGCGSIFRTGGDEFSILVTSDTQNIDRRISDFDEKISLWTGELVQFMTISKGMVSSKEKHWENIQEMIREGDRRMYEDKNQFYKKNGIDRRTCQITYSSLGSLYTKILRINLSENSYKIVKMDKNEQSFEKGYREKITDWLSEFAKSGQVFKSDVRNYLKKTDLDFMKNYFKSGNKLLSIFYKRKINGVFKDVLMEIIPADDYSDKNQTCFLYVKDISNTK